MHFMLLPLAWLKFSQMELGHKMFRSFRICSLNMGCANSSRIQTIDTTPSSHHSPPRTTENTVHALQGAWEESNLHVHV